MCNIETLAKQSFCDFEVIAVDDCSTDDTVEYLKELLPLFENRGIPFHIFSNKTNLGAGETRNFGLLKATGEYLVFLDSDDYFEDNTLLHLNEVIVSKEKPDIILFDYCVVTSASKKPHKLFKESSFITLKQAFLFAPNGVCGKCIKTSLIKTNKIVFTNSKRNEDYPFFRTAFLSSKNIYYLSEPLYSYVMNSNSLMHTSTLNDVDNAIIAFKSISKHTNDLSLLRPAFMKNCYYSNIGTMVALKWKRKEFRKRLSFLKKEYHQFYSTKDLSPYGKSIKLIVVLANLGFLLLLKIVFYIKQKIYD